MSKRSKLRGNREGRSWAKANPAVDQASGSVKDALIENSRDTKRRALVLLALLAVGALGIYWIVEPEGLSAMGTRVQFLAVLIVAVVAGVPPLNQLLRRLLDAARSPSKKFKAVAAILFAAGGFVYLIGTAQQQHRDLFPRIHDECSYTLQQRMLSEGRLWLPQHELADFFETFHVLTKPVYGSIYFPGTALMNVAGIWLMQPSWFVPVVLAGLVLMMSYLVGAEVTDGIGGILVALLVLCTWMFRVYSTMVMSQIPAMLMGLMTYWAWLRWRRSHLAWWAVAVGAFAGWSVITRPVDGLAFALPVVVAIAWELRRRPIRRIGLVAGCLMAGAIPFLTLQIVFDDGITGNPLKTPYVLYLEQNQPGAVFGSALKEGEQPQTQLLQKRIYYEQFAAADRSSRKDGFLSWLEMRARMTVRAAFPFSAAMLLIPAALLIAADRGRLAILLTMPLFFGLYILNPLFLLHYGLPLAPVVALATVLGARAVEEGLPWAGARRFAAVFFPAALACVAISWLPQFDHRISDEAYKMPFLDHVERTMAGIQPPAVVFFHFAPGCNVDEEPVYNLDTASPDDAPIIRAQDLGPRDGELLRYYAQRQPSRIYYFMDRRSGKIYALGDAAQAAAALHVSLTAQPATR
jgi:hypothetical protein